MTKQNGKKTTERRESKLRRVDDNALNAPWRNTPLDNWSKDTDPHILSGDKYVDNDHDLGTTRRENLELLGGNRNPVMAPFMHPQHDASMNNGDDELYYGDENNVVKTESDK
ncbi:DUF3905 domain-containing protein [Tumebacillus flagellatus]|uniref:Uncharacterized protein n=1 Tax=Tumebacillus flagellatus TaxID=1157490 RepID=A0A074M509_9BACL|nr:DUF3905 domain-containing protein [Tumebacillus flagellatus]KEO81077.1 hypothetical protein EL26_22835 [Tumebacillus flagellatus]